MKRNRILRPGERGFSTAMRPSFSLHIPFCVSPTQSKLQSNPFPNLHIIVPSRVSPAALVIAKELNLKMEKKDLAALRLAHARHLEGRFPNSSVESSPFSALAEKAKLKVERKKVVLEERLAHSRVRLIRKNKDVLVAAESFVRDVVLGRQRKWVFKPIKRRSLEVVFIKDHNKLVVLSNTAKGRKFEVVSGALRAQYILQVVALHESVLSKVKGNRSFKKLKDWIEQESSAGALSLAALE